MLIQYKKKKGKETQLTRDQTGALGEDSEPDFEFIMWDMPREKKRRRKKENK